jgi:hypothetical protein
MRAPENQKPIGFIKIFPVKVTIYDANDNIIKVEEIDYGNSDDKKWLGRVTFWALTQGYFMELEKNGEVVLD